MKNKDKKVAALDEALLAWRDKIDKRYLMNMDFSKVSEERIEIFIRHNQEIENFKLETQKTISNIPIYVKK